MTKLEAIITLQWVSKKLCGRVQVATDTLGISIFKLSVNIYLQQFALLCKACVNSDRVDMNS